MNPVSPLLLQAQILAPNGGGSLGLADTTRLENPFQAPMWLDEICFRLPGDGDSGRNWSSIRVDLKLGQTPITHGFVPISLLGKVLNNSTVGGEFEEVASALLPNCFTWKLPKPLYIPARELLRPTIYFDPFSGSGSSTTPVTILYRCRPIPKGTPPPQTMQIPWVTYFQPPYLALSGGPAANDREDQSTMSDIFNPWDEPLHVQRFVGRLFCQGIKGEEQGNISLASAQVNLDTGNIEFGTTVTAQDSFNNILIRDPTPFAHVFNFIDRSWTVNALLPPKGFYLFTIDRKWAEYNLAITATLGLSMVGWREVTIQRFERQR